MVSKALTINEAMVQVADEFTADYVALATMKPDEIQSAALAIETRKAERAENLVKESVAAHAATVARQSNAESKIKSSVSDAFNGALTASIKKSIVDVAAANASITRVAFILEVVREKDAEGQVTSIKLADSGTASFNLQRVSTSNGGGSGGGRSRKTTVDGVEYASAKAAGEAHGLTGSNNNDAVLRYLSGKGLAVTQA